MSKASVNVLCRTGSTYFNEISATPCWVSTYRFVSEKTWSVFRKYNPCGWNVNFINYPTTILDEMEQLWIKRYAYKGYQLRKLPRSQGEGKSQIADYRPVKGYHDGIAQGKKNAGKRTVTYHGETFDCGIEAGRSAETKCRKSSWRSSTGCWMRKVIWREIKCVT